MKQDSQIKNKTSQLENEQLFNIKYRADLESFFNNSDSVIILFDELLKINAFNKQAQKYAKSLFQLNLFVGENALEILPEFFKP